MSNNPRVIVELTEEQAAFLIQNCTVNSGVLLQGLQTLHQSGASRDSLMKIVEPLEHFKNIKAAVEKGQEDFKR